VTTMREIIDHVRTERMAPADPEPQSVEE